MSLRALVHGAAMFLLVEGVDERVAKEVIAACTDGCRSLINSVRDGYDGKAKDKALGL